jgi:type IV pilus assembly protein PilB
MGFRGRSAGAATATEPTRDRDALVEELADALLAADAVAPLDLAAARAGEPRTESELVATLFKTERRSANRAAIMGVWADLHGLDLVDLRQVLPDATAVALLDERTCRQLRALPLSSEADGIHVAVVDPSRRARAEVNGYFDGRVVFHVALEQDLANALDRLFRADAEIDALSKAFESTEAAQAFLAANQQNDDDDAPVVQIANRIIAQGLRDRASDVHVEPMNDHIRVRFRIDGNMVDTFTLPLAAHAALVSRYKILGGMNIVERRRPQDGQFSMTVDGRDMDVRVSTLATVFGEKVVMRLLDKSRAALELRQLGMPGATYEQWSKLIHAPFGMVICAGPTGAGKTTTLYATLRAINSGGKNVMTIEDPVEYVFPGINQIQTNDQAGLNFAQGLKAILRQDPDVILVGEVRDADTARIAVQSALTGHLVLSSLHGTDSVAALHRMLDMGIESFLIASSVVAVIGQRLLRRICDACKEPYEPGPEEMAVWQRENRNAKSQFWRGAGCNFCAGTGYRDRIGVYELLRITPELRRLIVGWATQEELRRLAVSQGMKPLVHEALTLVENDVTTISEVIRTLYAG